MTLPWNFGSSVALMADGVICGHLLAALGIGVVLGYERSYKGHSAGMRTYALVCMAATALVMVCGFPHAWFGANPASQVQADPTRVIQGIVTGIGFLGAGIIMKDGMSVRGLSSAASIWTVSAIGVLLGVGFYGSALLLACLCLLVMSLVKRVERALPHHSLIRLVLVFERHHVMSAEEIRAFTGRFGYQVVTLACESESKDRALSYDLVLESIKNSTFNGLIDNLATSETVKEFRVTPVQD